MLITLFQAKCILFIVALIFCQICYYLAGCKLFSERFSFNGYIASYIKYPYGIIKHFFETLLDKDFQMAIFNLVILPILYFVAPYIVMLQLFKIPAMLVVVEQDERQVVHNEYIILTDHKIREVNRTAFAKPFSFSVYNKSNADVINEPIYYGQFRNEEKVDAIVISPNTFCRFDKRPDYLFEGIESFLSVPRGTKKVLKWKLFINNQ